MKPPLSCGESTESEKKLEGPRRNPRFKGGRERGLGSEEKTEKEQSEKGVEDSEHVRRSKKTHLSA